MIEKKYNRGLVVFSGGQDSMTALGVARRDCRDVVAVTFDYGQRHCAELHCAGKYCADRNLRQLGIDLYGAVGHRGNALRKSTSMDVNMFAKHPLSPDLPVSWVPGRNAIFMSVAFSLAYSERADAVYMGVCQTDYSGYPDCRSVFLDALWGALIAGTDGKFAPRLVCPILFLSKASTFNLADELGILEEVLEESMTCYHGERRLRHDWGYGCDGCPACEVRKKGYKKFLEVYK